MKLFFEIGEVANMLLRFVTSDNYSTVVDALNGETKEDGFRGAIFIVPSLIIANCKSYLSNDDSPAPPAEGLERKEG